MNELIKEIDKVIPKKGMFKQAGYFLNKLITNITNNFSKLFENLNSKINSLNTDINNVNNVNIALFNLGNYDHIDYIKYTFNIGYDIEFKIDNTAICILTYDNNLEIIKSVSDDTLFTMKAPDVLTVFKKTGFEYFYISSGGGNIVSIEINVVNEISFNYNSHSVHSVKELILKGDLKRYSMGVSYIGKFTYLKDIYIYSDVAPRIYSSTFGDGSYNKPYPGYNVDEVKTLHVKKNATGYDNSDWTDVLLNPNKANFTIVYDLD